ncbi:hypothetical protein E1H13_12720 [Nodosilinea sp. P-1105]|nr:amidase family protein [Nodosilinea sp. P-1105]NMF84193.1 hypothetical protein [Nodosilinea sp. P-1105]
MAHGAALSGQQAAAPGLSDPGKPPGRSAPRHPQPDFGLGPAGVCPAGLRGGDSAHRQRIPTVDATVVQRLKAAGGICLGKTNVMLVCRWWLAPGGRM